MPISTISDRMTLFVKNNSVVSCYPHVHASNSTNYLPACCCKVKDQNRVWLNMFLVYRIIFCALLVCSCSRASRSPGLGYLFINASLTPFCYDIKPNDVCPPNLLNYKIVGFNRSTEATAKAELASVHLGLEALNLIQVSQACRDSYREYSCSNTFAVCTPDSKHGVTLRYDYARSKAACARVRSNCPEMVTSDFVQNCTMIQKDPSGYAHCTKLPEVKGDVCSKSSYTVGLLFA